MLLGWGWEWEQPEELTKEFGRDAEKEMKR